jgi:acetyl/propionyl-CoA carboxylase alpha subunit
LRIAAGEKLPFAQSDIHCEGHAIQARVTAERADQGFRPDIGRIALWSAPSDIRVDTGVATGAVVELHYDSLLAKLIATGADRPQALARLRGGLDHLTVLGPATNRAFLLDAIETPDFAEGRATTRLIADNWPGGWSYQPTAFALAHRLAALVAWLAVESQARSASPWSKLTGFRTLSRSGRPAEAHFSVASDGAAADITVTGGPREFAIRDLKGTLIVDASIEGNMLTAVIDGASHRFPFAIDGRHVALRVQSVETVFEVRPKVEAALDTAARAGGADGGSIIAPMPGLVADIMVEVGDDVTVGQTVAVLESMKLFTDLKTTAAGRISQIVAGQGATVAARALIIVIEPAQAPKL